MADEPTPMRDLQSEYTLTSDERGVSIVRYTPKLAPHLAVFPIGHQPTEGTVAPTPEWLGGPSPLVADVAVELGDVVVKQGTMFRTEGGMVRVGKKMRKRDPQDFYPTPQALCTAAVGLLPDSVPPIPWVLDPGAGLGPWGVAVRARWPEAMLTGVELDRRVKPHPAYGAWANEDFIGWRSGVRHDLIVGNPPFSMAEDFVRKSQSLLVEWGHILFLLRLGFLASQGRSRGLFKHYPPTTVYVCASRPSFLGEKSSATDATEYGLFHWWGNGSELRNERPNPQIVFWDWNNADASSSEARQQSMEF